MDTPFVPMGFSGPDLGGEAAPGSLRLILGSSSLSPKWATSEPSLGELVRVTIESELRDDS